MLYTRTLIVYWDVHLFHILLNEYLNQIFLIQILFWSPSVRSYATHSCGSLWYLSRHTILLLLLLTLFSLLFLSVALFSVIWVCLGHDSHYEVYKHLENRFLIWFSQEIPDHFISGAPLHWNISFVNPVSYKKYLMSICLVCFLIDDLPLFSRRIELLLSWYIIFSVTPQPWYSKHFLVHITDGISWSAPIFFNSVELLVLSFCLIDNNIGNPCPIVSRPPVCPLILGCTKCDPSM